MGLLDKVKNLFTEEVVVEDKNEKIEEKPEQIQKEVIQVEIPSPKQTRSEKHFEEEIEPKPVVEEETYHFPFFDDKDFDVVEVPKEKEEPKPKRNEVYNPPKEEKKVFKPSPIISPVYGFLDKDYQKEELVNKRNEHHSKKATVDEIRDKAFGSLESDIETTLFGSNRVLFDDDEKEEKVEDIHSNAVIDNSDSFDSKVLSERPRHERLKEDDDLTDLLEAEMSKPDSEPKRKPRKISDKELFSLIDSMYEGEK